MRSTTEPDGETLRDHYRRFAELEAAGVSEIYADWARGVSTDDEVISLLLTVPRAKRQANLVFAAARHLGAPEADYASLREWLLAHWEATRALILARSTQTNEAGRCAVLLPVLSDIERPLSLIEVGASAGLCLYPDRYGYTYDTASGPVDVHPASGRSPVHIRCSLENQAPPERVPEVAWRAGIDLDPLDITDAEQRRWLETLVWPEHHARRRRLAAAADIAAADPPRLLAGDLLASIESLIDEAPSGTRIVVFHSAVLVYVDPECRERFADLMTAREDVLWISNEGRDVFPGIGKQVGHSADGRFVLAVDGRAVALTGPHGQSYERL